MTATKAFSFTPRRARALTAPANARTKSQTELHGTVALVAMTASAFIWGITSDLALAGRVTLIVLVLSIIGWSLTPINDTIIALAASLVLVAAGALSQDKLFAALGHDIIWLIAASFVIAAVLRASGLTERFVAAFRQCAVTVQQLFFLLTAAISATAFVIPSTSGRAALLAPIYVAMTATCKDVAVKRAMALLFPTAILLSAGASLLGAGAHIIAVDALARSTGVKPDFLGWFLLAAPFAMLTTFAATGVILLLFLNATQRHTVFPASPLMPERWTSQQLCILGVLGSTVLLWATSPWHGISMALAALAAAVVLLSGPFTALRVKDAFRSIEIELIIFLAAALAFAEALASSGATSWMAQKMLPAPLAGDKRPLLIIAVLGAISLLSHLVITSRTARAAVLIPAFAVPLAATGLDALPLIMVLIMGSGFCQTMQVSAKPVALFGNLDVPTYSNADLRKLSLALLPVMYAALLLFGLVVW